MAKKKKSKAKPETEGGAASAADRPPPPPPAAGAAASAAPPAAGKMKIAVLGAGEYGTAMAYVAAKNGNDVVMYCRDPVQAASISDAHVNNKYLSDVTLPPTVSATTVVAEALAGAELIIHALPAQTTPDFLREHEALIKPGVVICSTSKGLYLAKNQLLSVAMREALGDDEREGRTPFAFLSGPSFAKEIVKENPTAVVVASHKLYHATKIQRALSNKFFRVYTSQDCIGVELGGALKNPLAVGAGMIDGMGFGINTMAAYVTRATRELQVLATAMGGKPETVAGLSGVGDLMLTAFGAGSRNRTCGSRLAKGESLADILAGKTVEGVPTASVAVHLADECGLELPIFRTVHGILSGEVSLHEAQGLLMERPLTLESGKPS